MELEGWLRDAAAAVALTMRGVMMTGATNEYNDELRLVILEEPHLRSKNILDVSDFRCTCPKGAMRALPTATRVELDVLLLPAIGASESLSSLLLELEEFVAGSFSFLRRSMVEHFAVGY